MIKKNIQQYQMLTRVVDFDAKHVGLFTETREKTGKNLAQIEDFEKRESDVRKK
jgi:hypothetical protein